MRPPPRPGGNLEEVEGMLAVPAWVGRVTPNRVAVALGSAAALASGAAVAIADMDTTSMVGVAVGVLGLVKLVDRWLVGWQAYESRQARSASDRRAAGSERPW